MRRGWRNLLLLDFLLLKIGILYRRQNTLTSKYKDHDGMERNEISWFKSSFALSNLSHPVCIGRGTQVAPVAVITAPVEMKTVSSAAMVDEQGSGEEVGDNLSTVTGVSSRVAMDAPASPDEEETRLRKRRSTLSAAPKELSARWKPNSGSHKNVDKSGVHA